MLFALALLVVAVGGFVFRAAVVVPSDVERWAREHALVLTRGNEAMVAWYLRTASVLRTLGVLAGLILPSLVVLAWGLRGFALGSWQFVFLGYLLGALYAEVSLVRPRERGALLVERSLGDYLPARLLWAQRALGAGLVASAVAALALVGDGRDVSQRGWVVASAVAGVAVLALELVQRWIVRRPQPMWSADLVSADDAIRSQSVHSIAGSALALGLVALSIVCLHLAGSDEQVLRWTLTLPGMALPWVAVLVCLHYGHRRWRVTRFDRRARPQEVGNPC